MCMRTKTISIIYLAMQLQPSKVKYRCFETTLITKENLKSCLLKGFILCICFILMYKTNFNEEESSLIKFRYI